MKSEHIYKNHNKTLLLYHLVFPAKYRKKVFDESVDNIMKEVCENVSYRYEIKGTFNNQLSRPLF